MEVNKADDKKRSLTGLDALWKKMPYAVAVVAFVGGFLVAALVWALVPKGQPVNTGEYQAVYLVNGQMYFGKLQNTEGTYLYLKTPYMPDSTNKNGQDSNDASKAIVRVKDQLWGPEDSIAIRADQVAFWQNLRDDSKVTQAIRSKE